MNRYKIQISIHEKNLKAIDEQDKTDALIAETEIKWSRYLEYLENYDGKRDDDPGLDCKFFEQGKKLPEAWCDTDGHYMCDKCKWNAHQGATKDEVEYWMSFGNWPKNEELKQYLEYKNE